MKKLLAALAFSLCCCAFSACELPTGNTQSSSTATPQSSSESILEETHEHSLVKILQSPSTCSKEGNIDFYFCWGCNGYYLDENATKESSLKDTRLPLAPHTGVEQESTPATCSEPGIREHWICSECNTTFADEACTQRLGADEITLSKLAHEGMEHREGYPCYGEENGQKEHWYCAHCDSYFLDALGEVEVNEEDIMLYSATHIPDFLITVPDDRDPIVLQLTDTQIIDGAQRRPEHSSGDTITYATEKIPQYCYDYIEETIQATHPDLIIITGDLIYGAYDDNGSALLAFIQFMDSFNIPWAPVFGNHDNESAMGADWQCQQLENAKHCLFKQRDLTGNGNYSVGLIQNGQLSRVFYMLDTNGCGDASAASLANGHTTGRVGFGQDQIDWYTQQIERLNELSPDTKISFAFHIQLAVFGEALTPYGFDNNQKYQDIYLDFLPNCKDGDFGYLGRYMKDAWDYTKTVYNGLKALGVDSFFVGHEHCNSASVVYDGIRFQYGQKSSEYDRYNSVGENGKIGDTAIWKKTGTPLVGGSVIVLSKEDGTITNAYIYYCENAGANVDWSYYQQNQARSLQNELQQLSFGFILSKKQ